MSGPKRADVVAALNTAARAAQAAALLIAQTEATAATRLRHKLDETLSGASELAVRLRDAAVHLGEVTDQTQDIRSAHHAIIGALTVLDQARLAAETLSTSSRAARETEVAARTAFDSAQEAYTEAETSLRQTGTAHYLTAQMAKATKARDLFEQANNLAFRAAQLRSSAQRSATSALETATRGVADARRALGASSSAIHVAQERARAAAEAARITEERRRAATVSLERSRIAVDALDPATTDKFAPGERVRLAHEVSVGQRAMGSDRFDEVHRTVDPVPAEASRVAAEVDAAKQRWDAARAGALAAAADLESLLEAVDTKFVESWADDKAAVARARSLVIEVQEAITAEDFDGAQTAAEGGRAALGEAAVSAAAAKGQDLRRAEIGEAVMDVLEELGFDVSVAEGTRDQPLRISGQTAADGGRGDFDIEIPLDGEIGFEVTASEGDTACISAVEGLQKKLAARGVAWNVTDWGHAQGAVNRPERRKAQEETQAAPRAQARAQRQARGQD